jgi:hypothetical protein
MTDLQRIRLSLALAIFGALTIAAHSWTTLQFDVFGRINLPTFERSAPGLSDWPIHQHLPIG